MKRRLYGIGRNIEVNTLDLGKEVDRENKLLPRETLSMTWDNLSNLVEKAHEEVDRLER